MTVWMLASKLKCKPASIFISAALLLAAIVVVRIHSSNTPRKPRN
jgi:hypothetical protein